MSLTERIEKDYLVAYKSKNQLHLGVLRLLKTAAKNLQVELMRSITDDELLTVIQKQAKQREDSIEQFHAAHRQDLADKEAAELEILKQYLPKQLTFEEIEHIVDTTIKVLCVTKIAEMGKVIQTIMAEHKGGINGKIVNELVRSRLQSME